MKNLAGEASMAGELQRHRDLLASWRQATQEDQHPVTPNPKAAPAKAGRKGQPARKTKQGNRRAGNAQDSSTRTRESRVAGCEAPGRPAAEIYLGGASSSSSLARLRSGRRK